MFLEKPPRPLPPHPPTEQESARAGQLKSNLTACHLACDLARFSDACVPTYHLQSLDHPDHRLVLVVQKGLESSTSAVLHAFLYKPGIATHLLVLHDRQIRLLSLLLYHMGERSSASVRQIVQIADPPQILTSASSSTTVRETTTSTASTTAVGVTGRCVICDYRRRECALHQFGSDLSPGKIGFYSPNLIARPESS